MIKRGLLLALSIAATGLLGLPVVTSSLADEVADEIDDIDVERCIRVRSLRSTKIVDDLNIIFYMVGSTTYHNILPRQCHGLARQDRFSYQSRSGNLCDLDTIRILYQAGTGMQEGNACRLGKFHPISREDADAILDRSSEPLHAEPIPMPEPEEIGAGNEESGDESQN